MSGLGDIVGTNWTAGCGLTEEEFFANMEAAFKYGDYAPRPMLVSPRTLEAGKAAGARAEADRDARLGDYWRLTRGWRRLRFVKKYRLLRAYMEHDRNARALRSTFGY